MLNVFKMYSQTPGIASPCTMSSSLNTYKSLWTEISYEHWGAPGVELAPLADFGCTYVPISSE